MNHANLVAVHAEERGQAVAIKMGPRILTYRELDRQSQTVACGLAELGVGIGDRVMMFAENSVEHLIVYQAAARLGAVFTPIHTAFKARELRYAISNAVPRVVIVDAALLKLTQAVISEIGASPKLVLLSKEGRQVSGIPSLDELTVAGGIFPPLDLPAPQPLLISYTSGTTSLPKPVERSHGSETWSAEHYRQAWGFEPADRVLVAMSLAWVFGLCTLSQTALATGCTIVLEKQFSPTRTLDLIKNERITAFAGTMSMYAMMLNIMKERSVDTGSLRKLFLGGEPRNETIVAEVERRLGHRLCEGWALTESFPVLAVHPVRDVGGPVGTLGRLVEGAQLRLLDDEGREVADGAAGEALIRSPGSFLGYHDQPELTSERMTADGWIRSGDLLRRDAEGYYTFVTRRSELIIRGGANISPAEIESAICAHPSAADAVVVGVPDQVKGESVIGLFTTRGGEPLESELLRDFLVQHIAEYKVPSFLFQVAELPSGNTSKKNRVAARVLAQELMSSILEGRGSG
ncbi:acyl--CoA ligase [Bradyrhizobium sp. Pear77]|uniref:class I adenylate-forming enzyme family protein n=1 Tax=Bradyrhizobium TaxID=374 RepID=UPI001E644702|nr:MULTISPECIES: class I adenylate-forming enzyme family protein [Bradyrhizobium]MCC8958124.1 acyl--CoA ligase [Bradyrhizobium altum]MCC8967167.1 acyl--CoA ligase [Bradyrhizobium oropedii]